MVVAVGGCTSGKISLDELDKFGPVRSAVWFEYRQDYPEGGDDEWHALTMSNRYGLCKDVQEMMPEMAEIYDDELYELYELDAYSEEDICKAYEGFFEEVGVIADPLYRNGVNILDMTFRDPDVDRDEPPEEDDYEVGGAETDDPYFHGTLMYHEGNPFTELADDIDCGDPDWYELDYADYVDMYTLEDGDAELVEKGDAKLKMTLEGELEDDDGDSAGDIEAKGTFKYCEVEWEGYAAFGFTVDFD
jgi:hypothetical protein